MLTKLMRLLTFTLCAHLSLSAAAATILVDEGHGQRFSVTREGELQLSGLAALIEGAGHRLQTHHRQLNEADLATADGLIISGAFSAYSDQEIRAIRQFAHGGGRVAILIHVGPLNGPLLAGLGVLVSNSVLFDMDNSVGQNGLDFSVRSLSDHPLFEGIDSFNLYGAWALNASAVTATNIAFTGEQAWIDLEGRRAPEHNPVGVWPVAVSVSMGLGEIVVFGDDAIFQNRFLKENNRRLADNLVNWLVGGRLPRGQTASL
ncbi:DUF4350 domain-containing protein [Aestuariirhabdus litorea]|nr:DUF4350 domain-containing protein [Aestuariirhabdus litorea]RWW93206.1 DUF4350 domain-containing protein [Endozoicomonadaceae bacterium GTF-13]